MTSDTPRILIVEQTPAADQGIGDLLTSAGYATRTAQTTQAALDMLADWHPNVLLVDLRVPSYEGRRFCASLAEHETLDSPPVVLLGDAPNIMKPTPITPFGLVATPINPSLLAATVQRAVAKQGATGEV